MLFHTFHLVSHVNNNRRLIIYLYPVDGRPSIYIFIIPKCSNPILSKTKRHTNKFHSTLFIYLFTQNQPVIERASYRLPAQTV